MFDIKLYLCLCCLLPIFTNIIIIKNYRVMSWWSGPMNRDNLLVSTSLFWVLQICYSWVGNAMPLTERGLSFSNDFFCLVGRLSLRSQVSPREICSGASGTGTGFSPSTQAGPVIIIPPILHSHSYISHRRKK